MTWILILSNTHKPPSTVMKITYAYKWYKSDSCRWRSARSVCGSQSGLPVCHFSTRSVCSSQSGLPVCHFSVRSFPWMPLEVVRCLCQYCVWCVRLEMLVLQRFSQVSFSVTGVVTFALFSKSCVMCVVTQIPKVKVSGHVCFFFFLSICMFSTKCLGWCWQWLLWSLDVTDHPKSSSPGHQCYCLSKFLFPHISAWGGGGVGAERANCRMYYWICRSAICEQWFLFDHTKLDGG